MTRTLKIGYYFFIAFLVVIGLFVATTLIPIPGNFQMKIVLSGSMEPAIKIGSLAIVKPQESYKVGDIITFGEDTRDKVPTTHRIIGDRVVAGRFLYTTKGDANDNSDVREVRQADVIGKVLFSVPFLGYILDLARKPLGLVVVVGIPAVVIIYSEARKILVEVKNIKKKKKEQGDTDDQIKKT